MPAGLDPCGERGEFQTFVVHHPGASSALTYSLGPVRHSGDFATLALKPF
jgi:diphthamide synthase (EF-2-diphthine--ammonia ligase)